MDSHTRGPENFVLLPIRKIVRHCLPEESISSPGGSWLSQNLLCSFPDNVIPMSPLRTCILSGLLIAALIALSGCTQSAPATTQATPSAGTVSMTPFAESQKLVRLETTMGNFTIALDSAMPITAGNFESLVKKGYYDGVIFHGSSMVL